MRFILLLLIISNLTSSCSDDSDCDDCGPINSQSYTFVNFTNEVLQLFWYANPTLEEIEIKAKSENVLWSMSNPLSI